MWRDLQAVLVLLFVLAPALEARGASDGEGGQRPGFYMVRYGWHANFIIPTVCRPLPDEAPAHLRAAKRIEVGWGDRRYYTALDPGIGLLLRAALLPTPSVLHVRAVDAPVPAAYGDTPVLRLDVADSSCVDVAAFVRESFVVEDDGLVRVDAERQDGAFYLSNDTYHLFHNCNNWMGRALDEAGFEVVPALVPLVGLLWNTIEPQVEAANDSLDRAASP